MTELPDQFPQANDAVYGDRHASPGLVQSAILGGIDGFIQQFPHWSLPEQQAALPALKQFGAAGRKFLVETTLTTPLIALRFSAYKVLQTIDDPVAQKIAAGGLWLYPGDKIYQIYCSGFNRLQALMQTLTDVQAVNQVCYLDQEFDATAATAKQWEYHRQLAWEDVHHVSPRLFDTSPRPNRQIGLYTFDAQGWLRATALPIRLPGTSVLDFQSLITPTLAQHPDNSGVREFYQHEMSLDIRGFELHRNLIRRALKLLVATGQMDMVAELWMQMNGPLAFVHCHEVQRKYLCAIDAATGQLLLPEK